MINADKKPIVNYHRYRYIQEIMTFARKADISSVG